MTWDIKNLKVIPPDPKIARCAVVGIDGGGVGGGTTTKIKAVAIIEIQL